jgi:hypothetical protein
MGELLGEDRSSRDVRHHVDELPYPRAGSARIRDQDKPPPVGHGQIRRAFGPRLEPTPKAGPRPLQKLLAALPGDLSSYRPPFEVGELAARWGSSGAMPSSRSAW